jgi:hypothetical protein
MSAIIPRDTEIFGISSLKLCVSKVFSWTVEVLNTKCDVLGVPDLGSTCFIIVCGQIVCGVVVIYAKCNNRGVNGFKTNKDRGRQEP